MFVQGYYYTYIGSDPLLMLDGVIPATRSALKKGHLNLNGIYLK